MSRVTGARLLALLCFAAAVLMVVDARGGAPVDPARAAVGAVVGPVEAAAGGAVRPFTRLDDAFRTNDDLRGDVAALQSQNTELRNRLNTDGLDRNRLAAYDGLVRTAKDTGYTMVPAHVVGIGAAQSFNRTVTLDAGTSSGITPDSTVVSKDGLVGRVIRATKSTSTVLLVVDSRSVVGGRLGSTMKLGFVDGTGDLRHGSTLGLRLVDDAVTPLKGDVVLTWGSGRGGPYVAGIPIGTVTSVSKSVRDQTQSASIAPFVDFGSLDLVGVVVPAETTGDRRLIHADGSVK